MQRRERTELFSAGDITRRFLIDRFGDAKTKVKHWQGFQAYNG
jgi:hypothetical protein